MPESLDAPEFWERCYQAGTRPEWDMRGPTPLIGELAEVLGGLGLDPGPEMAVPGCGYGHDAAEWARRGYRVAGVDFAPTALAGARERHGDAVRWVQADWFGDLGPFDGIFDHTCMAAMPPDRRGAYLDACARHLRPGGLWLGVLFQAVPFPDGPPFAISQAELRALVEARFELLHLAPATRSHPRRAGREFLAVARLRYLAT